LNLLNFFFYYFFFLTNSVIKKIISPLPHAIFQNHLYARLFIKGTFEIEQKKCFSLRFFLLFFFGVHERTIQNYTLCAHVINKKKNFFFLRIIHWNVTTGKCVKTWQVGGPSHFFSAGESNGDFF